MPGVFEHDPGRSASLIGGDTEVSGEIERKYVAWGYSSEDDVRSAVGGYLSANSLLTIGPLVASAMKLDHMDIGCDNWIASVTWKPFAARTPEPPADSWSEANNEWGFEIGLTNEKVYTALEPMVIHPRTTDSTTPPAITLIGDQGDGKPPAGVDLLVPETSFTNRRFVKLSALTESVQIQFQRLVGKVNNDTFMGRDPGEVLLAGISGQQRGRDDAELTFKYRFRENTTVSVDGFADIDKLGWEYIWPRYHLKYDGTAVKTTNEIQYLIVSKVFPDTSFSDLA